MQMTSQETAMLHDLVEQNGKVSPLVHLELILVPGPGGSVAPILAHVAQPEISKIRPA